MSITPDTDLITIITSEMVKDATKRIGETIKKKIIDSTKFEDPCPGATTPDAPDKLKK